MGKFVKGSYATVGEAERAVDELVAQGYRKDMITLVTNQDTYDTMSGTMDVAVNTDHAEDSDNESWWDKVKDVFTTDTYDEANQNDPGYNADEDVLSPYKDDINNGYVILLVDDMDGTAGTTTDTGINETAGVNTEVGMDNRTDANVQTDGLKDTTTDRTDRTINDQDQEKIRLQEERLNVDKNEVQTGELHVKKEVKTDTETVEVPVEHEEVTVERRPVKDGEPVEGNLDMEEEDITIPVKEEQIEVTKRPVVTEEVNISKDKKQDVKKVSEQVRKEDLDVETSGDVHVEDNDDDTTRRP